MSSSLHPYSQLVQVRLESADNWLVRLEQLSASTLASCIAGCGRRLGTSAVCLSQAERDQMTAAQLPCPEGWPLATLGRIALVVELAEKIEPHEHAKVVTRLYRRGDNAERVAVLRALPALPQPAQLLPLAVDACRSHVQDVFEAIACENSYPAEFFADANFYQLVLKAFFTEVETSRIVNLASRRSAELTRMAEGYASERRAAGRSVPADLPHVLGDSMSPALTSTHQDS